MNDSDSRQGPAPQRTVRFRMPHRGVLAGVALTFLAVGAAAGAGGLRIAERWRPQSIMMLQPTAVENLHAGDAAAIKGKVAEIFGNKFILDDGSGHALVDLGRRGENADAVAKGEPVTVQGMFDRGVVHAQIVSHSDGRSEAFGPPPPPPPRGDAPPPPSPGARAP